MAFTFRPGKRENVPLIIGLAGGTGSGKTYSALRLATGLAGGQPFALIDTEGGRGLMYADQFTFQHGDLGPPFRPEAYTAAITVADAAHFPVVVVDSVSHSWAGTGGVLDWQEEELTRMAGTDWKKREACKMAAWIRPKMAMKQFVQHLLQVRAHLILCFRAEPKIEMVKGADGKWEITEKKSLVGLNGWVPICEKNLPYELTASFLLMAEHPGVPLAIKLQAQHREFFPLDRPITEESGARLSAWARGGADAGAATSHSAVPASSTPPVVPPNRVAPEGQLPAVDWPKRIAEAKTKPELYAINRQLKAAAHTIAPSALAILRTAYDARLHALGSKKTSGPVTEGDIRW